MKTSRRLAAHALLCASLISLLPARAAAWGEAGHRIVARIAWGRLQGSNTRERIRQILGSEQITTAANWPDAVRYGSSYYDYADQWHFVSVPRPETAYSASHCRSYTGDTVDAPYSKPYARDIPNCVIGALAYSRATLQDPASSATARREAVRYIVHFVGDMHQPLHCSEDTTFTNHNGGNYDTGGNAQFVSFYGEWVDRFKDRKPRNKNLHATWDTYMISHQMLRSWPFVAGLNISAEQKQRRYEDLYVERLEGRIAQMSAAQLGAAAAGGPVEWVNDSHAVARASVYLDPDDRVSKYNDLDQRSYLYFEIGDQYHNSRIPVVEEQLIKAALRLEAYLREVLP